MKNRFSKLIVLAAVSAVTFPLAQSAQASLSFGAGGQGVKVGSSSLIGTLDYSDTFTGTDDGGAPSRPYQAQLQPAAAYVVENTYGHATQNFHSPGQPAGVAEFSIASDNLPLQPGLVNGSPNYPGTSGAGSASGFTQTGNSVDYSLNYGLRSKYIVQMDAVTSGDRIDMGSMPATEGFGQPNAVTVFFRATGGVSLYNATAGDHAVTGYDTGLRTGGKWHNYAVLFDQDAKTLQLYVDEQPKGLIDLNSFQGGAYANFSNAAVGGGGGLGGGENRTWTDNFQVGAVAAPEPTTIGVIGLGAIFAFSRRRRAGSK